MAINILGKLHSVAEDGTLADADEIDVDGTKLNVVLAATEQSLNNKEPKSAVKTSLDSPVQVNTEYFLGTKSSLSITLPSNGTAGDLIYITYDAGSTATTVTISGTYKGLDEIDWNVTNATYELCAMYNGSAWLFAWKVSEE